MAFENRHNACLRVPGSPKTFTGSVSGTNTSVLTIPASSLTTGSYIFRLTVTSEFTDTPTVMDFPVTFTAPRSLLASYDPTATLGHTSTKLCLNSPKDCDCDNFCAAKLSKMFVTRKCWI